MSSRGTELLTCESLDVRDDLHPKFEPGVYRTGEHRVRHDRLCCAHSWGPALDDLDEPLDFEECSLCYAVCRRDASGRIDDFELPSAFAAPAADDWQVGQGRAPARQGARG
jgi:hypothetical protein